MLFYQKQNVSEGLKEDGLRELLYSALDKLGKRKKVLIVPPDITRLHSRAGVLTRFAWQYYGDAVTDILPAIGTHCPMTEQQISTMFADVPGDLFRVHDWRRGVVTLGQAPPEFVSSISGGKLDYAWPAQVGKLIAEGDFDLILSIGQVVPHEVAGMANYNKNIFIGTGGAEGINKSHFLGAVCDMEKIMGHADTPVRKVLNYASENFAGKMPIVYILTVVKPAHEKTQVCGLFAGDDSECFNRASELSMKVNINLLDEPVEKMVVYLPADEYKSTWLGNKSIYRTRMALADGGELIVLAPGLSQFGEDAEIDRLIRKYGYLGTDKILSLVKQNPDLQANLSAPAHLIHGSSENRFGITYCPAGGVNKEEIESVNFKYAELSEMQRRYNVANLRQGFNEVKGEKIYFISNPGMGLWSYKKKFI